ncbi:helix-turn-helix domain-containing protein [Nocardioides sp. zg-1230]|uniref:helix-turn-helix domain-containing protein n=1 Tax=Nocardioides sp. zg-1230 TaxID=2736601 RepID=UPI001553C09F|nr:helix-turn-helix domain-containing protein [Nocardioides sp. zg-1230]NPC43131.1 helix-turn-helix domain-containing protein [Nocardioides sp. zg-1230]
MDLTKPLIRVDARTTPKDGDHPLSLAELLHVSSKTAWRIVRDGKVQSVKVGARRLVLPESVEAYLAQGGDA